MPKSLRAETSLDNKDFNKRDSSLKHRYLKSYEKRIVQELSLTRRFKENYEVRYDWDEGKVIIGSKTNSNNSNFNRKRRRTSK